MAILYRGVPPNHERSVIKFINRLAGPSKACTAGYEL